MLKGLLVVMLGLVMGSTASADIVDTLTNDVVKELKQAGKTGDVDNAVIKKSVKRHESEIRKNVDKEFQTAIKTGIDGFGRRLAQNPIREEFNSRFKCNEGIDNCYCRFVKYVVTAYLIRKKIGLVLSKQEIEDVGDYIRDVMKNRGLYRNVTSVEPRFNAAAYMLDMRLEWAHRGESVTMVFKLNDMKKGQKRTLYQSGSLPYPPFTVNQMEDRIISNVRARYQGWVRKKREAGVREKLDTVRSLIKLGENTKALKLLEVVEKSLKGLPKAEVFRRKIEALRIKAGNKRQWSWGVGTGIALVLLLLVLLIMIRHRNRLRQELRGNLEGHAQQVIEWLNHGSFVAADRQLRRLLKVDPENPELLELQNKLKLLCEGNPEAAEEKLMLESRAQKVREQADAMLKKGDFAGVERLRQANPKIFEALPEMQALIQSAETMKAHEEKRKKLLPGLSAIREDIEKGDPVKARDRLRAIMADIPDFPEARALMERANQKIAEKKEIVEGAKGLLAQGNVKAFLQRMKDLRAQGISYKELYELERRIMNGARDRALTISSDEIDGPVHLFIKTNLSIGKLEDNDCVIMVNVVSRHHAVIGIEGDRAVITDLGSKNGTSVNGRRIDSNDRAFIDEGDKVTIGGERALQIGVGHGPDRVEYVSVQKDSETCVLLAGRFPLYRRDGRMIGKLKPGDGYLLLDTGSSGMVLLTGKRRHEINGTVIEVEVRHHA